MLNIRNLSKVFNANTVNENILFNNFSLRVKEGDFITIIGSNGAGKSSLLNIISGSLPIDEGTIVLGGDDITFLPEYKRTRNIGRVFQNPSMGVSANMTILENMSMAYSKGKTFGLSKGIDRKNMEFFKEILSALDLGLENKLNQKVGLLSGGQRQALSLIMATISKPKLLLLDEHTAALDPKTSEKIIELTDKIITDVNITTLMVTHNLNHAIKLGNRLLMMHQGKVMADIEGQEKEKLTIDKLFSYFEKVQSKDILSDRVLFS